MAPGKLRPSALSISWPHPQDLTLAHLPARCGYGDLARLSSMAEAQQIMAQVLTGANHLGLLSEHFVPETRTQLGNFPQAYSHVGLINAAFAVSPPWTTVL